MKHNLATASFLFSELHVRSSPRKLSIMWPRIRKSSITWPRLPTQRPTINVISSNFGVKFLESGLFREVRSQISVSRNTTTSIAFIRNGSVHAKAYSHPLKWDIFARFTVVQEHIRSRSISSRNSVRARSFNSGQHPKTSRAMPRHPEFRDLLEIFYHRDRALGLSLRE